MKLSPTWCINLSCLREITSGPCHDLVFLWQVSTGSERVPAAACWWPAAPAEEARAWSVWASVRHPADRLALSPPCAHCFDHPTHHSAKTNHSTSSTAAHKHRWQTDVLQQLSMNNDSYWIMSCTCSICSVCAGNDVADWLLSCCAITGFSRVWPTLFGDEPMTVIVGLSPAEHSPACKMYHF